MTAVSRGMTIEYGSTTIGGSLGGATLTLHDVHSVNRTDDAFDVSVSVLVTADNEAGLSTGCAALETALTARRQDVKVTMGGSTFLEFKHTTSTALNIRSSIRKVGSPLDGPRSRLYEVRISGNTTPDNPPQTSSFSFSYGTVTVPGIVPGTNNGASLSVLDIHSISKDQDNFSFSATVLVKATDAATLSVACLDLESKFTTRRLDLVATMGGNNIVALRHSDNTALNTTSSITKTGSDLDSELTRVYLVTISGEVPTTASLNALREFNYTIAFSPSRRTTLTVSGTYTALGGTAASAKYLASIDSRVSAITTSLGGVWELVAEDYVPDDTDQVSTFSRTYQTLIHDDASTLYNLGVRNQSLSISTDKVGSSGLKDERKLTNAVASYSSSVDATVTKDLYTLWVKHIKPYMLTESKKILSTSTFAVTRQSVNINSVDNTIDATLEIQARSESDIISHSVTASDEIDMGKIISRVWPTDDVDEIRGNTGAYVYQGPKTITRTINETTTKIGLPQVPSPDTSGASPGGVKSIGVSGISSGAGSSDQVSPLLMNVENGTLVKYSEGYTPRSMGIFPNQVALVDVSKTWVYEYFKSYNAIGGI